MKKDSLLRSTGLFSLATLVSRFLGLARDACIAAFVPTVWQDIFWAGIKIPSTFRQLFAEGALSAAFIPLLTRVRERDGEREARLLGHSIFNFLALTLAVMIAVSILLCPWFVPYVLDFPEEEAITEVNIPTEFIQTAANGTDWRYGAAVRTTQIMFPFLFFVAISAWAMGVLNTYRHFFIPALASAFFNLSLIAGCVTGAYWYGLEGMPLIWCLGGAVVFGGFLQYAIQIVSLRQVNYFPPRPISPFHPQVGAFLRMLAPSAFGLAIYQINALVTQTYFASKYGAGGISQMQYAHRLIQFPLGVVGVALATASFPRIAQQIERSEHHDAARTLSSVIRYLMLLMIPAAAGLIALGPDIVGMIYDRGFFHEKASLMPVYYILVAYCVGLVSYAMIKVLVRTFQAHHNFRTPVIIGGASVVLNIGLCAAAVRQGYPLWSLGLASALASTAHALTLLAILWKQMRDLKLMPLILFTCRVVLASAVMGASCYFLMQIVPITGENIWTYGLRTGLGLSAGLLFYGGLGWILFQDEIRKVLRRK